MPEGLHKDTKENLGINASKPRQLYKIKQNILYRNLEELATQSTRGGFYNSENRIKIYKLFLNYSIGSRVSASKSIKRDSLKGNDDDTRDEIDSDEEKEKKWRETVNQIKLDVNRTFGSDPVCSSDREIIRENLTQLLLYFFKNYGGDWLSYYQGFHEVASILLGFGMIHAKQMLPGLTFIYLRDFMEPDMKSTLLHCQLILNFLSIQDETLYTHLTSKIPDFNSYFSIPWLLTWFSHAGLERESLLTIFDALICNHPALLHCIACQLLISERETILECSEMSEILMVVLKLPKNKLDFQHIINEASIQLQSHKNSKKANQFYDSMGANSVINTYKEIYGREPEESTEISQFRKWSMENRMDLAKSAVSSNHLSSYKKAQWNTIALGLLGLTLMFILSSNSSGSYLI